MCGIMKQKTKVEILICLGVILILSKLIYEMISETYFTYFINNFICYILSFLMSVTIVTMYYLTFCKYQKKIFIILIIAYFQVVGIMLFYRQHYDEFTLSQYGYIRKWINILFTNKIVFINVIGNIILFIPLGYIARLIKSKMIIKIICLISFIVSLELLQYITKRGVFDFIDIILNISGSLIGMIIACESGGKHERKKTKRQEKFIRGSRRN